MSWQKEWPPSEEAFQAFLAWLSPDREEAGKKLEGLKAKLLRYFTLRRCQVPDELFWETVARAANRKHSGKVEDSTGPVAYCFRVAHLVYLEWLREPKPDPLPPDLIAQVLNSKWSELELDCCEKCKQRLPEDERMLITRYYEKQGREKIEERRKLAEEVGGLNTLRIKVFRIKKKLHECVSACVDGNFGKLVQ